jgi:uncharacterized membrane protein
MNSRWRNHIFAPDGAAVSAAGNPSADVAADSSVSSRTIAIPRPRLDSVDFLRGLVMVIMALDHVRDFLTYLRFDPTDLTQTYGALFFTRWITHFCAPVFVFLAGTGAFLSGSRGKSPRELSRFLLTRGIWLIIAELTIVRLAWLYSFDTSFLFVQVIWVIGWSMIILSGLIHLRVKTIAIIGGTVVVLHNLLDGISPAVFGSLDWLWMTIHVQAPYELAPGHIYMPFYPMIPWPAVMALGYAFGALLMFEPERRRRVLFRLGFALTVAFFVIRGINVYGDLVPWSHQSTTTLTIISFFNTTKYPPSLCYLLMTLGPAIIVLALADRGVPKLLKPIIVFGRVPMFYYVIHLYVVHGVAVIAGIAQGFDISAMMAIFVNYPKGYGFSLPVIYLFWIGIVVALYPLCLWFAGVKRRRRDWWLSYI